MNEDYVSVKKNIAYIFFITRVYMFYIRYSNIQVRYICFIFLILVVLCNQ